MSGIEIQRRVVYHPLLGHLPIIVDNGGVPILILCFALSLLAFRAPEYVEEPRPTTLFLAIILAFLPLYHIGRHIPYLLVGRRWGAQLLPSLVAVVVGTFLLLTATLQERAVGSSS
jgi:hypothetical protein